MIFRNRVVAGIAVLALAPFTFLACGDDDNDVDDAASRVRTEVAGAQTGVAGGETPTPGVGTGQDVTLDLDEINASGVRGQVMLRSEGTDRTRVEIRLDGQADDDYHAAIYSGTCADFSGFGTTDANRDEVEELDDVDDGRSETTVDRSMAELTRSDHVVALREDDDDDRWVACADIEDSGFGGPTGSPTPFGGSSSGSPTPFGGGSSGSPTPFSGGTGPTGSPTPNN